MFSGVWNFRYLSMVTCRYFASRNVYFNNIPTNSKNMPFMNLIVEIPMNLYTVANCEDVSFGIFHLTSLFGCAQKTNLLRGI